MLSMTDLVWNHTADNSPWLKDHPEAGYNLNNSPHLKAAFALVSLSSPSPSLLLSSLLFKFFFSYSLF